MALLNNNQQHKKKELKILKSKNTEHFNIEVLRLRKMNKLLKEEKEQEMKAHTQTPSTTETTARRTN